MKEMLQNASCIIIITILLFGCFALGFAIGQTFERKRIEKRIITQFEIGGAGDEGFRQVMEGGK